MKWSGGSAISQSISMETFSARGSVLQYENVEVFHFAGITYKGPLLPVGMRNSCNMARCNTLATVQSITYTDFRTALHMHCCCPTL